MKIPLFPAYLECEKCGFLAASKKDLQQHAKFHKRGPELKLFCEHCSFVTDAKSRLMRHKRIHTNVSMERTRVTTNIHIYVDVSCIDNLGTFNLQFLLIGTSGKGICMQ